MSEIAWPLRKRAWWYLHAAVNQLASRYAPLRDMHWLWRLNNWLANRWTGWWISESARQMGTHTLAMTREDVS